MTAISRNKPRTGPRDRLAGFAIASPAVDKCRASLTGKLGEYHYNCPVDNLLFTFKGITPEQFKAIVRTSANYEEIGIWLESMGTPKTPAEVKAWSDGMEAISPMSNPEKRAFFIKNCSALGLNPETSSTFDWLDADDRHSFRPKSA